MPITYLTPALLAVSVLTNLTVEAVKKILDQTKIKYSSNILAAIVAVVLSAAISIAYLLATKTAFSIMVAVEMVALMYLSFLVATVGYDKVMQTLKQIIH